MTQVTIKTDVRDDGCASVMVFVDGKLIIDGWIGGEPEDNSYQRDYNWIDASFKRLSEVLGADVDFVITKGDSEDDMADKRCWICRRTEEELLKEFDGVELIEVESAAYTGMHVCDMCRNLISSIMIDDGFALDVDVREAIGKTKMTVSMSTDW